MNSITIDIFEDSDGEFQYNIFKDSQAMEDGEDSLDGGACTGSLQDALEMAYDQAKDMIKREEKKENEKIENAERLKTVCSGCGKEKDLDLIVCWQCFKHPVLPFKHYERGFVKWMDEFKSFTKQKTS